MNIDYSFSKYLLRTITRNKVTDSRKAQPETRIHEISFGNSMWTLSFGTITVDL